jgi:hypothetical protein
MRLWKTDAEKKLLTVYVLAFSIFAAMAMVYGSIYFVVMSHRTKVFRTEAQPLAEVIIDSEGTLCTPGTFVPEHGTSFIATCTLMGVGLNRDTYAITIEVYGNKKDASKGTGRLGRVWVTGRRLPRQILSISFQPEGSPPSIR